jgi:hypothetical protein
VAARGASRDVVPCRSAHERGDRVRQSGPRVGVVVAPQRKSATRPFFRLRVLRARRSVFIGRHDSAEARKPRRGSRLSWHGPREAPASGQARGVDVAHRAIGRQAPEMSLHASLPKPRYHNSLAQVILVIDDQNGIMFWDIQSAEDGCRMAALPCISFRRAGRSYSGCRCDAGRLSHRSRC